MGYEGATMTKSFPSIWLIDEEKMRLILSRALLNSVIDDVGLLEITSSYLVYRGKKSTRYISDLKGISLFHQEPVKSIVTFMSVLLIMVSVVSVLAIVMLIWRLVYLNISMPVGVTLLSWFAVFALLIVNILNWSMHLSSFGLRGGVWWLKIDYLEENSQMQTIYLRDGSKLGWGGKLGGTQTIHEYVEQTFGRNQSFRARGLQN